MIYLMGYDVRGPIKIGRAVNPKSRRGSLQAASVEELVLFMYGEPVREVWSPKFDLEVVADIDAERDIHRALSEYRVNGEWFEGHVFDLQSILSPGVYYGKGEIEMEGVWWEYEWPGHDDALDVWLKENDPHYEPNWRGREVTRELESETPERG